MKKMTEREFGLPRLVLLALVLTLPAGLAGAVEPPLKVAEDNTSTPLGLTARELDGMRLHSEDGEALGGIEAVLSTADGRAAALAVEVDDGLLGIGDRTVVLRFDQVRRQGDRVTTRLSEAQLEVQPRWDD